MNMQSLKIVESEKKGCQKKLLENDVTYLKYRSFYELHFLQ